MPVTATRSTEAVSVSQQMRDIDREMKKKLNELHDLMTMGEGLDESVDMIEKCKQALQGRQNKGENVNSNATTGKKQSSRCKISKYNTGNNTLGSEGPRIIGNKTKGINQIMTLNSVETLYESAIPKRNSSSSEEDDLNVDLECLPRMSDNDKRIVDLISERRCSLSQELQDHDTGPSTSRREPIASAESNQRNKSMPDDEDEGHFGDNQEEEDVEGPEDRV